MGIVEPPGEIGVPPATMRDYIPTCHWPTRPVRRIAVLTSAAPHPQLVAAVARLVGPDRWVRWVQRGPLADPDEDQARAAFDETAPWWEWADVVISDADNRSIAECVANGRVPVVGLPSPHFTVDARRSLELLHSWSARGLALHLSLEHPSLGLLESAAGLRTRRSPERRWDRRSA